jgi:hypothetical protein
MKSILILFVIVSGLILNSCGGKFQNNCLTIDKIISIDRTTCQYHILCGNGWNTDDYYIIDTAGRFKVGDTILKSSIK